MSVNHDQAIFDAIVAATGMSREIGVITISTKKFIDTFNGHRDRKLCTSLDVGKTPTDYQHGALYVYDATSQTFDPAEQDK